MSDEKASMINELCEAISRIRWARGTDKLDAAIFEAVRIQGIADAGGYAKLTTAPPVEAPPRPDGCICSEAYGIGPKQCGKHAVSNQLPCASCGTIMQANGIPGQLYCSKCQWPNFPTLPVEAPKAAASVLRALPRMEHEGHTWVPLREVERILSHEEEPPTLEIYNATMGLDAPQPVLTAAMITAADRGTGSLHMTGGETWAEMMAETLNAALASGGTGRAQKEAKP